MTRIRLAWAILRGRSVAYRLTADGPVRLNGHPGGVAEVTIRGNRLRAPSETALVAKGTGTVVRDCRFVESDPDYIPPDVLKRRAEQGEGAGAVSGRPVLRRAEADEALEDVRRSVDEGEQGTTPNA